MMRFRIEGDLGLSDVDVMRDFASTDPYVAFVSSQVMRGVVEHPEVSPDWIQPRMAQIQGKYKLGDSNAYEALRLSEELAYVEA